MTLPAQTDLISYLDRYPHQAGFRVRGTSEEAARKLNHSGKAEVDRQRVLFALRRPMTAKETAAALGMDINSVRPRISELKNRAVPLVEETGERRNGQNVYRAVA